MRQRPLAMYIGVTASVFVLVIIIIVALTYWRYRGKISLYRDRIHDISQQEVDEFYEGMGTCSSMQSNYEALLLPYNMEHEISKDKFTLDGKLKSIM